MDLNKLSRDIYAQNCRVGWWDDPDRCLYTCLQLVSTEVAEATEGERKNLTDDHLPHRRMGEVELADALIRVLDLGGHLGWEYGAPVGIAVSPITIPPAWSAGRRHLAINIHVCRLSELLPRPHVARVAYTTLVDTILAVSESFGYDTFGAVADKLAYNACRIDHTREHRAAEHGKKF